MKRHTAVAPMILLCAAIGAWAAAEIPDGVKSLVQQRCDGCHKGTFAPKGLNLKPDNLDAVLDRPREVPELKIIDTKAPEASYLLKKVRRETGIKGKGMPPGKALTAEELKIVEDWILGLK